MATLQQALKSLGPTNYTDLPLDNLNDYISSTFRDAQLIIDSVPIPPPEGESTGRERSGTTTSVASSASEVSVSSARSASPPADVQKLQKEWKPIKLNAKENPLGMNVYKLPGSDGKGAWFARRSVHEGLGFKKWKRGLEMEFPETLKVQGAPGEGNIRGIGGEKRVEHRLVPGLGKLEVYHLSAQFPGPTTPRDFVTLLITSDQALAPNGEEEQEAPRHFIVVSKPCIHPDTPERQGFIRGQYESVEIIREIPINRPPVRSSSSIDLGQNRRARSGTSLGKDAILRNASQSFSHDGDEKSPETPSRARGKTISFAESRGAGAKGEAYDVPPEEEDAESNPVEWIMITRSDPGGSVPRFLVERGTPAGIVNDASKFLDWCCGTDIGGAEEHPSTDGQGENDYDHSLREYQTNGHLVGIDSENSTLTGEKTGNSTPQSPANEPSAIATHIPGLLSSESMASSVEQHGSPSTLRRHSTSSISTVSSSSSYTSAVETRLRSHASQDPKDTQENGVNGDTATIRSNSSSKTQSKADSAYDKEMAKLEEKKQQLNEKLKQVRERAEMKKNHGEAPPSLEEGIRKAEERYERELKKHEEKYKKEIEKIELKQDKERKKAEDRRRKELVKDERGRMLLELETLRADVAKLTKERQEFQTLIGELQAENTVLAAKLGRLALGGDDIVKEIREQVAKSGRQRAGSLKSLAKTGGSFKSSNSGEQRESLDAN